MGERADGEEIGPSVAAEAEAGEADLTLAVDEDVPCVEQAVHDVGIDRLSPGQASEDLTQDVGPGGRVEVLGPASRCGLGSEALEGDPIDVLEDREGPTVGAAGVDYRDEWAPSEAPRDGDAGLESKDTRRVLGEGRVEHLGGADDGVRPLRGSRRAIDGGALPLSQELREPPVGDTLQRAVHDPCVRWLGGVVKEAALGDGYKGRLVDPGGAVRCSAPMPRTAPVPTDYDAVLLDIEGTTTSIAFVYDTLFPYARREVERFLRERWGDEGVQGDVELLRAQASEDAAEGAPSIAEGRSTEVLATVVANVHWQMDRDRKTTGLKALQGRIWTAGYGSGELLGHVFEDVAPALGAWRERDVPVYIYSSGSVRAQQLLFGGSEAGDLRPLLAGYFDTTTGPKKVAASYGAIAELIGRAPERVVFVTDSLDEARAADEAGMQLAVSLRRGNPELPDHPYPTLSSFEELDP